MAKALVAHGRNEDETAALIYDGSLPSQRTVQGTLGRIAEDLDAGSRGAAHRRFGGRPARPPALVRRAPTVRQAHRRDPLARAGRRAGRDARRPRRRGDPRADDPDPAARGLRSPRPRLRGGRHLRLADFHQHQRRRPLHGAAARDRRHPRPQRGPHLHGRAIDRRPAGPLRAPHRPHPGRVPRRRCRAVVQGPWTLDGRARAAPARGSRAGAHRGRTARRWRRGHRSDRLSHRRRRQRS